MRVYLAGPIEYLPYREANAWRGYATAVLELHSPSIEALNPSLEINRDEHTDEEIVNICNKLVESSDVILADISRKVQSSGTPMEIKHAYERGIPVIAFGETKSPHLRTYANIFPTVQKALRHILEVYA